MQIPGNMGYATKEETIEGWREWKAGNKKAFEKLQCTACKLAITAAHAFLERGPGKEGRGLSKEDVEDCVSEATVEALKALTRWDPVQGHLSTLVIPRAEGAVANWINAESNKGMATKHEPNAVNVDSLDTADESVFDDDGEMVEVRSEYGDQYAPSPLDILIAEEEHRETRKALTDAMRTLPEHDRIIVCRAFGVGRKAETHDAIARSLGVAQSTVTRRLEKIQAEMKKVMEPRMTR